MILDDLAILRLLTRGLTMKEIAAEFEVDPWRVRERLERMKRDGQVRTTIELVWLKRFEIASRMQYRAEYMKQRRRRLKRAN